MQFADISGGTILWESIGSKLATTTQASAHRRVTTDTFNVARNVTTGSTVTGNSVVIRGVVRVGVGGGVLIPQVQQTVLSGSFTVQSNTYFKARRIGLNNVSIIGDWV
jgi:hypothetical protein